MMADSLCEALSMSRVDGKSTKYLSFLLAPCPITTAPILMSSPSWSMLSPSQSRIVPVSTCNVSEVYKVYRVY